jgi:type II secretory pathway component PulF
MSEFRYQAVEAGGASVAGVVQAEDRKSALRQLGQRGLYPSSLELTSPNGAAAKTPTAAAQPPASAGRSFGHGISRKQITALTREISALLAAAIPIPQALDGLGEEEENPALKTVILEIAESVRKGTAFSAALGEHPRLFSKLYCSMVRVGEEGGVLPRVMADLALLLEHEDEVRGDVRSAVAYPAFVFCFGIFTVIILLTVVLPRLFGMMEDMLPVLPLPTLVLLRASHVMHQYWPWFLVGAVAIKWYLGTASGAETWDQVKLRLPLIGPVVRAAALSRFARTLGTLAKSGVSLLPALKIAENTIGNRILARQIANVAEETRGGDSLAAPLRKLGLFPRTMVQMIDVGEQTGKLDEMLLKVAEIEERQMRARTKILISLLAPALILVVGSLVGFMVMAILLPIFKMSSAMQ